MARSVPEDLVRRWRQPLFALALARTGSVDVAEDVVQTVLLRVLRRGGLSGVDDRRAYLVTAVENLCRNVGSRARVLHQIPDDAAASTVEPPTSATRRELGDLLRGAIRSLPDTQQTVVWLVHVEGLKPAQVCELTGLGALATKSALARGRKRLREQLGTVLRKAGYLDV